MPTRLSCPLTPYFDFDILNRLISIFQAFNSVSISLFCNLQLTVFNSFIGAGYFRLIFSYLFIYFIRFTLVCSFCFIPFHFSLLRSSVCAEDSVLYACCQHLVLLRCFLTPLGLSDVKKENIFSCCSFLHSHSTHIHGILWPYIFLR